MFIASPHGSFVRWLVRVNALSVCVKFLLLGGGFGCGDVQLSIDRQEVCACCNHAVATVRWLRGERSLPLILNSPQPIQLFRCIVGSGGGGWQSW